MASLLDRLRPSRTLAPAARPRRVVRSSGRILPDSKSVSGKKSGPAAWQTRSWDMYDRIPFLGAAYNYQADQVARVTFFPAIIQPGDANPVPLADILSGEADKDVVVPAGVTDALGFAADDLLVRCRAKDGGLPEIRRQLTLNLRIPGEGYGVWTDQDDGSTFMDVYSTSELVNKGGDRWEIISAGQRQGVPIDFERQALARILRRHPQYKSQADSAMRRLLDPCEELLLLAAGNRALLSSRIASAGVLLIQAGLSWGALNEVDDADPTTVSTFVEVLTDAMRQAIRDPSSTDAVVPIVVEADGELDKAMHHVAMERPLREADIKRAAELVVEIVRGMDVVPETVFGLGEAANFATARVITAEAYNAYIDPLVLLQAGFLTSSWVRPGLLEMGFAPSLVGNVCLWRDPSQIIAQPDMAKNAVDLLNLGELSGRSGRKALGFDEGDAPDDSERAAFQARSAKADPAAGPNAGDRQLQASAVLAIEATSREVTVSQRKLDNLSRRLADIDRSLMTRLQVACDHAVERTLRTVGARLRSAAQGNASARPLLDGTSNLEVGQALGPGMVAQLGVDVSAEISPESFTDLASDFDSWVAAAQRRAIKAVHALAPDSAISATEQRMDDDRRDGWVALAASLVTLARSRVFSPVVEPSEGEFDPTLSVPPRPLRHAIGIAGGSGGATNNDDGSPMGLIGTGLIIRELARSILGVEHVGWTWMWGGSPNPFPPHFDLDDVDFDSPSDPVLANVDNEWPYGAYWTIDDHAGCECIAMDRYSERVP